MFFQTAGIEVAIWIPPLVAFVISFFTSMGGVSGAFLLLPFQMSFLGYTNPSVSATNQVFNIVAIPGGVYRFWKEGRLVWPLAAIVIIGTLPGVFMGAMARILFLPDPKNFKFFASLVLFYIAAKMISDLVRSKNKKTAASKSEKHFQEMMKKGEIKKQKNKDFKPVEIISINYKHLNFRFYEETFNVSIPGIFGLSLIVGIIGGIYGIGGGSIIAPFFISFFHLPVYIVAGAALMGTFVTSIAGVIFYSAIAPLYPEMSIAPDWLLGVLFGTGGLLGIYLGARVQKYVPANLIKWMLAFIILFTAGKYLFNFFGI
ncbi:MAG: sulfite exporter TauE/SafE family protein [Proteobacteria bacterium]|nr:sulfite exporter TauE/SafE family protein [Pseudomonadota bacterium]MBU1388359.1 sulfite exporter TauE/SafE family protein [Pseudomonadota bacterium]MBU1542817.1 sulfite exporter TauE/SafE family protein [Pseudomonadota bacterium]MBU2481851.1 sulfite exporter TauE/SafE family protein [Pseudomonadota bacterium]